jgi:hypothetical protein
MSHMMLVSRVLNGLLNSEETGAQDEHITGRDEST